jgi:hypothetical protein
MLLMRITEGAALLAATFEIWDTPSPFLSGLVVGPCSRVGQDVRHRYNQRKDSDHDHDSDHDMIGSAPAYGNKRAFCAAGFTWAGLQVFSSVGSGLFSAYSIGLVDGLFIARAHWISR